MHALLLIAGMAVSQDTTWAPLARVVDDAIASRTFPGAVVVIGRHDTILYQHAFGHFDYEHGRPVTLHTEYDLASLTKVIGLTTAMMQLVEEGRVGLDTPAVRYVPAFSHPDITVRQLLTHSSGLPAWKSFWQRVWPDGRRAIPESAIDAQRAKMFALVDAEPLEQSPGTKMVYSDLGAMVMDQIVDNVSGERLDRYLEGHLFRPLGMTETRYRPPASRLDRIAPTEMDTTWRHGLVHGTVHDENAWSMGGISSHAGLFSTGPDLAKFAQFMLSCLAPDAQTHRRADAQLVECETVRMFTQVQQPGFSSRALGWDTPSENSSAGSRLTAHAFGHTGFTGTSIWIDPDKDLFIILLSNRVYPTRDNPRILAARRAVADTAVAISSR